MTKHFIIRVDAGSKVGWGHLIRCLAIAEMVKDDFCITLCIKQPTEPIRTLLTRESINEFLEITSEEEFFGKLEPGILVLLDGYSFNSEYQLRVKNKGCKLVCIDDLHAHNFFADFILNHAPGVHSSIYKAQPYTQFGLGLEFALLRPAFLKKAQLNKKKTDPMGHLFIGFGGSDIKNLTKQALSQGLEYSFFNKISVVTGASYHKEDSLEDLLKDPRVHHFSNIAENEMANLLYNAHIAIVPSSGMLYEAVACQTLTVTGYYTENQKDMYHGWVKYNRVFGADDFTPRKLKEAIDKALEFNVMDMPLPIDGLSPQRIKKVFLSL